MQSHPGQGHKLDSLMVHLVAFYDMQGHSSIHSHVCPRYRAMLTEPEEIRNRWKKYIETVYDKNGNLRMKRWEFELELDVNVRIEAKARDFIGQNQFGFRKGCGR